MDEDEKDRIFDFLADLETHVRTLKLIEITFLPAISDDEKDTIYDLLSQEVRQLSKTIDRFRTPPPKGDPSQN